MFQKQHNTTTHVRGTNFVLAVRRQAAMFPVHDELGTRARLSHVKASVACGVQARLSARWRKPSVLPVCVAFDTEVASHRGPEQHPESFRRTEGIRQSLFHCGLWPLLSRVSSSSLVSLELLQVCDTHAGGAWGWRSDNSSAACPHSGHGADSVRVAQSW